MEEKKSLGKTFTNGLIKENPVMVLLLGMCATLAVSTSVINAVGMGLCTTAVLVCSNVVISAMRKIIPNKIRIASFIVVIAAFVTIVEMLLDAFLPSLSSALGVFLPLIVVNCIILGRAEGFASKNGIAASFCDGLGMGLGFTLTLLLMGIIREFIGSGSLLGHQIYSSDYSIMFIAMPCGGFLTLGCIIAAIQYLQRRKEGK